MIERTWMDMDWLIRAWPVLGRASRRTSGTSIATSLRKGFVMTEQPRVAKFPMKCRIWQIGRPSGAQKSGSWRICHALDALTNICNSTRYTSQRGFSCCISRTSATWNTTLATATNLIHLPACATSALHAQNTLVWRTRWIRGIVVEPTSLGCHRRRTLIKHDSQY